MDGWMPYKNFYSMYSDENWRLCFKKVRKIMNEIRIKDLKECDAKRCKKD